MGQRDDEDRGTTTDRARVRPPRPPRSLPAIPASRRLALARAAPTTRKPLLTTHPSARPQARLLRPSTFLASPSTAAPSIPANRRRWPPRAPRARRARALVLPVAAFGAPKRDARELTPDRGSGGKNARASSSSSSRGGAPEPAHPRENAAPLAIASGALVVAGALVARKFARDAADDRRDRLSLVPASTATGEPAFADPSAAPDSVSDAAPSSAPSSAPVSLASLGDDAMSSFAAMEGRRREGEALAAALEEKRAELESLAAEIDAFEATLKSGGKKKKTTAIETTTLGTKTPIETTNDDAPSGVETSAGSASSSSAAASFANDEWWDIDIDERNYRAAPPRRASREDDTLAEKRRLSRRKQRLTYFRNNSSVRRGSPRRVETTEADLRRRLKIGAPPGSRVFDSREIGSAAYGLALAALCREQNLAEVRGEGTFSDVYATSPPPPAAPAARLGEWAFRGDGAVASDGVKFSVATREDADRAALDGAVIKCSVPFPGVIAGRRVGDGLGIGEVEARVLSELPRHPNVVRLLAAFLSEERNESYLLLGDAGANLHAMRERGEVSPRDVRRHARSVFAALAHCHAHGVVHRDVKGGNILVREAREEGEDGDGESVAVLIDFGVARRVASVDAEPAHRYGTPGYQAPELLMSDMSASERDASRYQKVDVFAMGCTLFFLCVGKELYGATGEEGEGLGARTKTKARAQATQAAMEEAMDDGGLFSAEPNLRDREAGLEEEMVVRRRRDDRADDAATPPDARDALSFGAAAATLNPMFAAALGRKAAMAEAEAEQSEEDLDMLMLEAMAEFPGYEPRDADERAYVEANYGGRACPPPAPPHRESLAAFVRRKLCPRQPPGFASLVAACLSRNPEERPTAAEALNWPGAWVQLDADADETRRRARSR